MTEAAKAARRIRKMPPQDVTVDLWLTGWRVFFPSERTAETARHDDSMVNAFKERYGRRLLSSITALMAQEWARDHPSQLRYLREPWEKAVAMRLVDFNVWTAVRLPRRPGKRRPVPSVEEVTQIIRRTRAKGGWYEEYADLLTVTAYTGARLGGIASLCVPAVDLAAKRVTLTEKGSKTRTVALLGPSRVAAGSALARAHERRLWPGPAYVFRSKTGRPLSRESIGKPWREVKGDFGGTFHSLRHFAATWLASQGVDDRDIAIQLGHTDSEGRPHTKEIRRIYNHPDPDEALQRIEAQLAGEAA